MQAGSGTEAPRLFAKITVALPPLAHAGDLAVLIDAPGAPANPDDALTPPMFGHHTMQAPVTFVVPRRLGAAPSAAAGAQARPDAASPAGTALSFRVAPLAAPVEHGLGSPSPHASMGGSGEAPRAQLLSVVVGAH